MTYIPNNLSHVKRKGGQIYYVAKTGNDSYEGIDPEYPFLTIKYAIT